VTFSDGGDGGWGEEEAAGGWAHEKARDTELTFVPCRWFPCCSRYVCVLFPASSNGICLSLPGPESQDWLQWTNKLLPACFLSHLPQNTPYLYLIHPVKNNLSLSPGALFFLFLSSALSWGGRVILLGNSAVGFKVLFLGN
jgi:hypothetical protein